MLGTGPHPPAARCWGLEFGAAVAVVVADGVAESAVVLLGCVDVSAQKVVVAGTLCTGIGGGGIRTAGCAAPGAGSGIALLLEADGRLVLICEEGLEAPINTNSSDYSSSYARKGSATNEMGEEGKGAAYFAVARQIDFQGFGVVLEAKRGHGKEDVLAIDRLALLLLALFGGWRRSENSRQPGFRGTNLRS